MKAIHINNNEKLFVLHRLEKGGLNDDTIVVINFSNKAYSKYKIGFPRHGEWLIRFNTDD